MRLARGPSCAECKSLQNAFPLLGDWATFVLSYRESPQLRKRVEAARKVLLGKATFKSAIPGQVTSQISVGTRVEVPYLIYSKEEFLKAFSIPPEDIQPPLPTVNILNECNKNEDVILLRDKSTPRRLLWYSDSGNMFGQNMCSNPLRLGEDEDRYKWLVGKDVESRGAAGRTRLLTFDEVAAKATEVIKARADAGMNAAVGEHRGQAVLLDEEVAMCPMGALR